MTGAILCRLGARVNSGIVLIIDANVGIALVIFAHRVVSVMVTYQQLRTNSSVIGRTATRTLAQKGYLPLFEARRLISWAKYHW